MQCPSFVLQAVKKLHEQLKKCILSSLLHVNQIKVKPFISQHTHTPQAIL